MKYVPVDWWFPNRTFCQMDTCKGEVTSTYKRQFKDFQTCWEGSIPLVGWVERSETP